MNGASPTAWQTRRLPGPAPDPVTRRAIHFTDADEALEAAQGTSPEDPVLLIPPPSAAGYLGLGWFHLLSADLPDGVEVLVDCGIDPALTFEAIRQGFGHVAYTGEEKFVAELAAFTTQQGAILYRTRPS